MSKEIEIVLEVGRVCLIFAGVALVGSVVTRCVAYIMFETGRPKPAPTGDPGDFVMLIKAASVPTMLKLGQLAETGPIEKTVGRAVNVYHKIVTAVYEGGEVVIRRADGTETEIEI